VGGRVDIWVFGREVLVMVEADGVLSNAVQLLLGVGL
jgi:hypothetical protein